MRLMLLCLARTISISLLFSCAACSQPKGSKIYSLALATSTESCGDSRGIIAVAIGGHRAKLNIEPDVPISQLVARLRHIMSYRVDKAVYVEAEPDASWGEFLELASAVWPEADIVSIVTPRVWESAQRNGCLGLSSPDRSKVHAGLGGH
jgi:hypothetical protein